jgi:hypothetical protein
VTIRGAKERIVEGSVPLPDPTNASEVLLSHDAVDAVIRRGGSADAPLEGGEELDRWSM